MAEITSTNTDPAQADSRSGVDRLELAERSLPRRKFFDDMPDKGLFAVAAVMGFLGILILKLYSPVHSNIIAALSVAIMILYGIVAFRLPAIQMRPDRLGDNFYYLGFIYTLASLSAALFQLQSDPNIEELLGNFGIALITTVVGVAGRVLFAQMRGELDEVEERVRRDLASASADLRAQLVASLREFETFHVAVLQASAEVTAKTSENLEGQLDLIRKAAERAAVQVEARVNAASIHTEKLAHSIERVAAIVGQIPSLRELELPGERLESQIISFTAELETLIAELRSVVARSGRRRWYWPFRGKGA